MKTKEEIQNLIIDYFPKEKSIREEQQIVLELILDSFFNKHNKHFIAELPTGVGKSLVATTFARILSTQEIDSNTTISTHTKILQHQYENDFGYDVLKGVSNYSCNNETRKSDFNYNSSQCRNLRKSSNCRDICPYTTALKRYEDSNIRIANNSLLLSKTIEGKTKQFWILDEAHHFADSLIDNYTLEFNSKDLETLSQKIENTGLINNEQIIKNIHSILMTFLKIEDVITIDNPLFNKLLTQCENKRNALKTLMDSGNISSDMVEIYNILNTYFIKLSDIINKKNIACYSVKNEKDGEYLSTSLFFKPIYANVVNINKKADFFLHLSGTIMNIEEYAKELGLTNYSSYTCDSPFDVSKRKIILKCDVDFSYKNRDDAHKRVGKIIDTLIEKQLDKRIIVHTSSYYQAHQIRINTANGFSIEIPSNERDIKRFLDTKKVLIGPSLYEGVDYYDDRLRTNVLAKVQFGNLGDPYTKLKMNLLPDWYEKETVKKFIQAYGRGVRHFDDYCDMIILDSNFSRIKNSKFIPRWIKDAYIELK
jgi:Rad3-related DNA helicase